MFILISKKKIMQILFFTIFLLAIICFLPTSSFLLANNYKEDSVLTESIRYKFRNIYRGSEKVAYLTFDDGPSKKVTPKILDILKENDIKATFFVIGKKVEENPSILKRIYEEGHFIGNHTYSHDNSIIYNSKQSFINEFKKTDSAIAQALNIPNYSSHVFRFPNGLNAKDHSKEKKECISYLDELDATYLDWNALNQDSMQHYSTKQLLQNLKDSCANKGPLVILMHDTGDVNNTYDVLQDSIDFLKESGYTFSSLSRLFLI